VCVWLCPRVPPLWLPVWLSRMQKR
ncbi:uncharacterized protein METZ01_LOCUS243585, partial [marine metagenome]